MCNDLTICDGAFKATLEKAEDGTESWKYTPIYQKPKKKVIKGTEKEKPQFAFVEKSEKEAIVTYQSTLKKTVLDIVKYLKTTSNA